MLKDIRLFLIKNKKQKLYICCFKFKRLYKKLISKILLFVFWAFLLTPSTIVALDSGIDVSIFYGMTEEKQEKTIEINSFFSDANESEDFAASNKLKNNVGYYCKKYQKPHLNIIFPPPDYLI